MEVNKLETIRVSVRALAEFTFHGEDICPAGSVRDRMEGILGHQARQKLLGDEWESEVSLSLSCKVDDELEIVVSGRMDAFRDTVLPEIEEIKLTHRGFVPDEPDKAHWAQAVCYGYMLCTRDKLPKVLIRVAYVTRSGNPLAVYEKEMTSEECESAFQELLIPFLHRQRILLDHKRARDASLYHLSFPYDTWRKGQREMAVQVYTAIVRKKRLFASMPTGCGKSMAALFPAIKALGMDATDKIFYLTARTTQRQGPAEALAILRRQPLNLWTLTLDAKDKQCPRRTLCHPDFCPRAKGHYLRDAAAIEEMLGKEEWTPEAIRFLAEKHQLCPFEFSLSLTELADIVVCDYNYALDPAVHLQRIFDRPGNKTLLIDEAHHLNDRVRDMLGGRIQTGRLRKVRTLTGKASDRKHPLYKALSSLLREMEKLPSQKEDSVISRETIPSGLGEKCEETAFALLDALKVNFPFGEESEHVADLALDLLSFARAWKRDPDEYAMILEAGRTLDAFALNVAPYIRETTAGMAGTVCFSATLDPLPDMKNLLGGTEEDACFAVPSPFPPENLLVIRERMDTRYQARKASLNMLAERILQLQECHPGRYIVFFPSFAYMEAVAEMLPPLPFLQVQRRVMAEEERQKFLEPYLCGDRDMTSLCVMGGIFSEGIDLPGKALDGAMIIGTGLPQVNVFQKTLQESFEITYGDGFAYAYRIPGMQKVAQAAGRVIRTETDRGVVVLMDNRYFQKEYLELCPQHWQIQDGNMKERMGSFWREEIVKDDLL